MIHKPLLIAVFLLLSFLVNSQNLVKNPSFEEIAQNSTKDIFALHSVKNWEDMYCCSVDKGWEAQQSFCFHFHKDLKDEGHLAPLRFAKLANKYGYKAPCNFLGYQYARTGSGYVAFGSTIHKLTDMEQTNSNNAIYGELTEPLKKNTFYQIVFYISLADRYKISPDSFIVAFRDSQFTNDEHIKTEKRQIEISAENIQFDSENWTRVSANYFAKGGENYFAIRVGPRVSEIGNKEHFAIFVDDVSVSELRDTLLIDPDKPFILKNIVFATGSAELLPKSFPELERLRTYLFMHPDVKLEISGHTDDDGDAEVNMQLSKQRAESVRKYLTDNRIDGIRLTIKGYGETSPVDSNATEEGKANNRRVEVKIIK
jgi:outer membrane protein OmpA-like peptidoglycan-associated protein